MGEVRNLTGDLQGYSIDIIAGVPSGIPETRKITTNSQKSNEDSIFQREATDYLMGDDSSMADISLMVSNYESLQASTQKDYNKGFLS